MNASGPVLGMSPSGDSALLYLGPTNRGRARFFGRYGASEVGHISEPPLGAAITCAKGHSYFVSSAETTDDISAQW
jgi:hypothetical protein